MSERILYVDDDEANLEVLRAACEDDFDVVTVDSGAEALARLEREEFAVLLADQRMPQMTGVEVLERACAIAPETIRILITAYSDLTDAIAAINRGHVRRYIRKPWDPDELTATLRDAVEMYDARRRLDRLERQMLETERVYALGVVAAGIAHELRNPLSVLTARLGLARSRMEKVLETLPAEGGDVREAVDKSLEYLDHAFKASDQVLEIAQGIDLGQRRRDEDRSADLRAVVDQTLRSVRGSAQRRARLDAATGEEAVWVRGSSTKISQIALNLVVNAIQALPDRPRDRNRIGVWIEVDPGVARLVVEDNGPGVPEADRDRIFDPFYTTKTQGGTGLGLAISRRIVEEIEGTLELEEGSEGGARFVVTLPRVDAERP